jgi:transcriptional regulator CtsR
MSSHSQAVDIEEINQTLYRHGLSIAVLLDLLIEKNLLTAEEIRLKAGALNRDLLDIRGNKESEIPDSQGLLK